MPTMDDLAKLASQLYKGNPSIGAKQYYNGQWDQDAATALGFTSSDFRLWAGEEYASDAADSRYFGSTSSYRGSLFGLAYRDNGGNQAVCLGD